jgi:hypothetical protein
MTSRPLDPRICNVAIDANSLDRLDADRAAGVDRLLELRDAARITLIVPKGVRLEFQHPATPRPVREAGSSQLFTVSVGLNPEELRQRCEIERELQGNAKPCKHRADADHLFEAAKYCGYFITHDDRILRRAGKLRRILPPLLTVVTLAGFLKIFDAYEQGDLHE